MRKLLLLATTTALVAGLGGTASAASLTATSLVQQNNGACGKFVEGLPINGTAKFTRTANKLQVTYKAKHLAKSATYSLEFFGNGCSFLGTPATFVTTATGSG